LTLLVFSHSSAFRMLPETAPLRSSEPTRRIYGRTHLSNSSALRAPPVCIALAQIRCRSSLPILRRLSTGILQTFRPSVGQLGSLLSLGFMPSRPSNLPAFLAVPLGFFLPSLLRFRVFRRAGSTDWVPLSAPLLWPIGRCCFFRAPYPDLPPGRQRLKSVSAFAAP
jgi:hypothetical protein